MNLIKTNLEFQELKTRRETRRMVIHHSASPDVPAAEIHKWHLANGWSGIGYHFIIRQNGNIEEGRPLEAIGAHAGPEVNPDSIGICLTGDFTKHSPSREQIDSLLQLVPWLRESYQSELAVLRHCDVVATECPGQLFPWDEVSQALSLNMSWKQALIDSARSEGLLMEKHDPDEPAPKWFVAALVLNLMDNIINREGVLK
ncbi:MAG: peptidoglycan recognition family protein [Syntrophomonadaceae bacterium]|jgi:N-acetyl-anhydromuramyl-L-alanine amidase AmpD